MANYAVDDLINLLPPIMVELDSSGDLKDFLEVFVDTLNYFDDKLNNMANFYNVNEVDSSFLKVIAEQLGVLFNFNFTDEQLRSSIQKAVSWYKIKGTKSALQKLLQSLGYIGAITELAIDPSAPTNKFADTSDFKPEGDMDSLTGWNTLIADTLTLTSTVGEYKVGASALKFNKTNTGTVSGITKDYI